MIPQRKILMIDDDPVQARIIEEQVVRFRGGQFALEHVTSSETGLKKLLSGNYAACLLDYWLEGRNGLELLREAKEKNCATPIIILTADTDDETDLAALEAGAADFLLKGEINTRLLERSIRYALKLSETFEQLRRLATHDELTALLNRREFDRIVREEWQRSTRFERPFALVLVDIDHFKAVNDTHGHQVGDAVLRHVASLLAGQIRAVDRVTRYGGEEFALVMVETERKTARDNAERLRALLAEIPCVLTEKKLTIEVTISAGVAACPEDTDSVEALIAAADSALYAAKRLGRNRVVTAKPRVTQAPWQAS